VQFVEPLLQHTWQHFVNGHVQALVAEVLQAAARAPDWGAPPPYLASLPRPVLLCLDPLCTLWPACLVPAAAGQADVSARLCTCALMVGRACIQESWLLIINRTASCVRADEASYALPEALLAQTQRALTYLAVDELAYDDAAELLAGVSLRRTGAAAATLLLYVH